MPSPDKLFRLDPVSTDLTSPVTQVQIQKAVDDSRETQQLYKGLESFGNAIGSAAAFAKKRRIKEDTKIAENAALRNEVLPGGFLPIAVESYNNVVDLNTANPLYDELDLWSEGEAGEKLVSSNELSTDAKITSLDNVFEDYWARASSAVQNPSVLLKFKTKLDAKKIELKKGIFKVEKDLKTINVIQAVQNTIKDGITYVERSNIFKGTELTISDVFTKQWINTMSKDIKNIFPDIDISENKLLILHTLSTNPDILSNPSVIYDIMKSEYNKGITYNTLYNKGLLASNTDEDAKEIVKIFNSFITNSDAHLDAIEKAEEAQDKALEKEAYNKAWDVFQQDPANTENAVDVLKGYGRSGTEVNKFRIMVKKYQNNEVKHQIGSPSYLNVRDLILNHNIRTKPEINEAILLGFLASETKPFLEDFLSEEGKQITRNVKTYKERVKTLDSTAISSMKGFLRKDVSEIDLHKTAGEMSTKDLIALINPDSSIKPEELRTVLIGINELRFDIQRKAEQLARQDAALEGTGEVTEEGLEKIQQAMNAGLDTIIKGIEKGLLEGKPIIDVKELPKLKVPTLLTLPSLAPKTEKELDVGEFTQLTEPTGKVKIELNQDDVNEMQKIVVQDKVQAKEMIEQLAVYENKLKEEERKELKSKRKATPKGSKLKEETTQEAKEKLIVDVPLSKKEQAFLDKLKSEKDPTGAKKKEATPKVKTRAELLQENPKAAEILKRQEDFLADKDRDQKAVKEKPPLLESDQVIANKQALFDHLDANQVPSKQQWTDLVEGISKETTEEFEKSTSKLDDISSSFFNLTDMIFGGKESEIRPTEPTKEIKPSEVSPKKPSPDTTTDTAPFAPTLETFSEDFIGKMDTRKGLRPIPETVLKARQEELDAARGQEIFDKLPLSMKVDSPIDLINKVAKETGGNPKVLKAILTLESSLGKNIKESREGARGIAQFMPATARGMVKNYPKIFKSAEKIMTDHEEGIKAASVLIERELLPEFKNTDYPLKFAFARYNSSTKSMAKARKLANNKNKFAEVLPHLPTETRDYMQKANKLGVFK